MANLSHSDARRLYSWWWDSHNTPKNSKWLLDNIADMDGRVKSMIKLIELDADSFARRAEMYYKNRPELMKLVEEFYRAYRALAERYDHVTGELRHAHKTIAAAFPDHLPFELVEDSPPNPLEKDEGESSQDAVNALKKALTHMEAEKEDILLRYHQCREKLANAERELNDAQMDSVRLNEKAFRAEIEVQTLNEALIQLESECMTKTSELEKVVSYKEDEAMKLKKQLESSESEVSDLKRAVAHLNEEKEASALQYKHCLETIDKLERLLSSAECEVERLNHLVLIGTSKLKTTEEKCNSLAVSNQALQVEADNLVKKIAVKDQELSIKEVELDKLQSCLHDENTRREKAEATLETLQNLQTQSQDDQRAIAAELSNMLRLLEAVEGSKRGLEEEFENHSLSGSSFLSLREIRERLEREVTHLVGINTSLQHEISCLKEEIELLNSKKLENVEEVLKKKVVAGRSLSELNVELEMSREKVKALQESCQLFNGEKALLAAEKASLLSQFQATTENMNKLLGQNAVLENSVSAVKVELEGLREKSKGLEEICKMLKNERSFLLSERDTLILKLDNVERKLQSLENKHLQLREKYADLERENEAMRFQVERLEASLGEEKRQRAQMAGFENEIHSLQEENRSKKKESENELEKALKAQFEISILQKFIKDMESKNYSLIAECQKHVEASNLAEKVIKELESDSLEQQVETELLLDEIGRLRLGIYQIFAALEDRSPEEETETDPNLVNRILESVEGMKFAISKNEDEKQHLFVENSVLEALLKQLESKRVDEMKELGSEMELQKAENSALKDTIFRLEREMHEVRECNARTKVKLFDAEMQLEATEKMNTALFKTVAELRIDSQRSELVREDLEQEMVRLSETNSTQMKEIHHLHKVQKDLESEIGLLNQEIEEKTVREQTLSIELQGMNNEFEICEAEAASFCFDLQVSSVKEVLLKDKVQELTVVCQSLEHKYAAKTFEFEQMKAQNCVMENEINRLKSKVSGYGPVIASLTDDITLLELKAANSHGTEFLEFLPSEAVSQAPSGDETILSLQNLQKRVQVVGKLMEETNKSVMRRRSNAKSKQEGSNKKEQKTKTKTKTKSFKVRNTIQMKDIPLDQASDGKRGNSCSDDHMLELWETVEDGNRGQIQTISESRVSHKSKGRSKDYDRFDYMKGKLDQPSTDSDMEKELAVDKLEISSRITEHYPELNDKNILEKLASDADKLESLQTTLYGLRKKLEANKKNIKAKNIDFETVKEQLKEAEDSLLHLVDLNVQLVKNIEECPPDDVASPRLKETVKLWRIKVMEQAAKGSEKLDLLLLAVQKIQFFVSKMDDEANKFLKGRTVILRDFIHSGRRNSFRRKQGPRFGCFRQSDS